MEVGGEWVQKRTMAFGSVAAVVVVMIHNQVVWPPTLVHSITLWVYVGVWVGFGGVEGG